MKIVNKLINKLSLIFIDTHKDWGGYRIENLGAPNATGHALRRGDDGLIDHGSVAGLGDDDHTQYLNTGRHDTTIRHPLGTVVPHDSHADLSGVSTDQHHARSHDHSLAGDGSPIAVAGVPDLPASKITSGRFPTARMPDATDGYVLTAKGPGVDPAYEALAAAKVSSGTYSGNNTSNRAIAHGLGVTPKIVFITRHEDSGYECWYRIVGGLGRIFWQWSGAASPSGRYAIAAPDATNFYIGNSSDYSRSANYGGDLLYWVAIA